MSEQDMNFETPDNQKLNNNPLSIKVDPFWSFNKPAIMDIPVQAKETPLINNILKNYPPQVDSDIQRFLLHVINNSINSLGIIRIDLDLSEFPERAKDSENYLSNYLGGKFTLISKTRKNNHYILTFKQKKSNAADSASKENLSPEALAFEFKQDLLDNSKLEVCLSDSILTIIGNGPYGHYLLSKQIKGRKELKVIPRSRHAS